MCDQKTGHESGKRALKGTRPEASKTWSSVLFCCSENAIRSPIAEALLKRLVGRRLYVDSCGVRAGDIDGFAVAVLQELALDVSRHHSKSFEDLLDDSFDVIVAFSSEAYHRALRFVGQSSPIDVFYRPVMDPSRVRGSRDERLAAYRQTRDAILAELQAFFHLTSRSLTGVSPETAPGAAPETGLPPDSVPRSSSSSS